MKKKRYKRIISIVMVLILLQNCFYYATAVISSFYTPSAENVKNFSESFIEGDSFEECVECRVIVKATHQPNTYGYAESIIENNNLYIYQYSNAETAKEAVEYYNSLPYVKWAELDGVVESQALSYGNYMMQGDEAKDFAVNSNVVTDEVVVAVLDSGMHFQKEYLNNRVVDSGCNLSNSGTEGSAKAENNSITHGTHVASIIVDNTSENVKVVAYKVMNKNGKGSHSSIALGIEIAVDDGADVINMSLGGDDFSNAIYDAIKYAYSKGVIIVCAAGNDGGDAAKHYPASYDEVLAVGSIDSKGHYSIFSNHGEEVDFVAPGHNIEFPDSRNDYGTSFSAPFVSAAAAMVLSANPELTINQAKNILIESCVPYEELSYYDGFHIMHGYEGKEYSDLKECFVKEYIEDESLYYGYGMPQIQNAVGIALSYEEAIKPEFSVESGTYHNEFEVTISAPEGYEIYYTTDETYPAKDYATLYSSPIEITETQSIRAVAYSPDGMRSLHNTAEYRVLFLADENDFTIDSNGYLTSYTGSLAELIVPETINGITVTGIRENAIDNDDIRSIVLPETLTHIKERGLSVYNAIYISAKGLKTVDYDGVWSVSVVEFDAPNLEKIESVGLGCVKNLYFPKLKEIGEYAFYGSGAKEIYLPLVTEVPCEAFGLCVFLREIHLPSVTSVDYGAFSECYWLKVVDIPNLKEFTATDDIDEATFYNCLNLVEVDFQNVEKIEGEQLFEDCNHLEKVSLPKAQNICTKAFLECSRLTDIYIPNAQVIEDYAFAETASLAELELPNAKELGDYVFKNSAIETVIAPELETIGQYCFTFYNNMYDTHSVNTKFTTINAPKLKTASDYSFAYTGALTKLELPSLTDLGVNAFLESSVSYLDAPKLQNASSLPTAENSIAILSSEFSECSLDATGYDLTIYGTYGTYAEAYANQYNLTFVGTPAIVLQPAPTYSSVSETLETNAIGVDLTYQWYGTDNPANLNGTAVDGATNKVFDPTDFESYPYYYCLVTSTDGDCIFEIKTNIVENSLHFYAADYTALEDAIAKIPANLSIYTDESVAALNDILNSFDRNLNILHQKRVDEYVIALTEAIEALKLKSADYTELDNIIAKIPANLSIYTDESVTALNSVLNSIDKSLNITQQEQVDGYVIALTEAIKALKLKSADYTALEAAIANIPVNLSIYTDESVVALNDVLNSIDRSLDITQQDRVNEYVIKVNNSVASLVLKSADYAELEIAIKAVPSDLSIYTDDSSAELKAILAEIDKNLDITNQAQIDKWAEEIPIAVQKLILKPADYLALEKAIAAIPSDLSVYTEESVAVLQEIIDSIDYSLDVTQQEQVDEYAEKIIEAIRNLKVECWLIRLFKAIIVFIRKTFIGVSALFV